MFRVVERPVRECVKLLNLEDTTLFDDIRAVREASREILGYCVDWHPRHKDTGFHISYACNTGSMERSHRVCSVDVGYEIWRYASGGPGAEAEFVSGESDLGLSLDDDEREIYFDTEIDDDEYDKFDTCYDLYLL